LFKKQVAVVDKLYYKKQVAVFDRICFIFTNNFFKAVYTIFVTNDVAGTSQNFDKGCCLKISQKFEF